ncbi:YheC/YheD family protein [Paenibacillus sp. GCM10023248]|uniref:YheC/YheD family protein n=1 Tax=unclassified Paenibacillus TaxID=185978 RepID=UPI0023784148|nr:YheC/YheD family protein [Paenibacillus sp. MAHUQ-63]MDD9268492.1 YheC/YheD family protein [Paenibacillus sp. MAHUQ-63]
MGQLKYASKSFKSKWQKTKWLLKHRRLRRRIPRTMPFNRKNLRKMLSGYPTVYFKPTGGTGGFGIIRIKRMARGYQTKHNTFKSSSPTFGHLYKKLSRFSGRKSYLLQQGIRLAKTKGKPFDIRVMVQKTNEGKWISTAICTKIGKPDKVATNYHQGGRLGALHQTLAGAGYKHDSIVRKKAAMKQLGVAVGKSFDLYRRGFRELGLDVALDTEGKLWILEVNTRPAIYPWKYLKGKRLYRRILSAARQYGRVT